ncbi:energy transducer TonB [Luteimonas sp. R10]|uniref:energy transducer TonB n=1 Tax=Luteimonas sp. R10 TaxID=3108176 RepID=UPI00308D57A9|nr:energy transducer TonB [Luteimonas sp. R10]
MVPQHAHAHARPSRPHPDPVRIAGISGTLLLNVVALCLLLVPVSQPQLLAPPETRNMEFRWIEAPELPPDPPPIVETVPEQTPPPQSRALAPPEIAAPAIQPVVVDQGLLPAEPVTAPAAAETATIEPASGPVSGMRLAYASAPAPRYPREAIIGGLQGTVLLEVLVDVDGSPLEVRIHRSSGHRVLDDSARRHVLRNWRFQPATRDGQPVQAIGLVPIDFNLDRG